MQKSEEKREKAVTKMCLKITYLQLQLDLIGAYVLNVEIFHYSVIKWVRT